MDLLTLDVTGIDPALARAGALCRSARPRATASTQAAEAAGTIGYEILTLLGTRYARVYRGGAGCAMNFLASRRPRLFGFLPGTGRLTLFTFDGGRHCVRPPIYFRLIVQADHRDRLLLAAGGRADRHLHRHGAGAADPHRLLPLHRRESAVATVVVLSITRELGPVIAGLMVAGRVGAAMAAEIGTMRVTDQIDALDHAVHQPDQISGGAAPARRP